MMTCELTTDWSREKFNGYAEAITKCLAKYVETFPDHETLENLAKEIMDGSRQLWVVMERDELLNAFLTEIVTINATGKIICRFAAMAGEGGLDSAPLINDTVGGWAKAVHNADVLELIGRRGWARALQSLGFKEDTVVYRKSLQ